MTDVIVIGGGPAGCYTAALLAEKGFTVELFEEHPVIGQPIDCSGVIGVEAFEALSVPQSIQLGEIGSFNVVSPSGQRLRIDSPRLLARIVDRGALDHVIARRAEAAGAKIHLGLRVVDVLVRDDRVIARLCANYNSSSKGAPVTIAEAKMAILATGPRYRFHGGLGMGRPGAFLKTAQIEAPIHGIHETEILVGSSVAPGSFAWVIPFQRERQRVARIGVSGKVPALPYLRRLLKLLHERHHLESVDLPIRSWVIPVGPVTRSYSRRTLAVGDAAGQTKPTTGGGIYYGICSAHCAAYAAAKAFAKSDFSAKFLERYENQWWQTLGRDIRAGTVIRRISERLTDSDMERIIRIARSYPVSSAISKKLRFDWHRDLIQFVLNHPLFSWLNQEGDHAEMNS